ncbi:RNA methyltransferase [bacterium]|jgi:tRNA G18 (ribose-2'-O)-methylase SpoU|nr:RNA methyltransferase [bacterium]
MDSSTFLSSPANPIIKQALKLKSHRKYRTDHFIHDHEAGLIECCNDYPTSIEHLIFSERYASREKFPTQIINYTVPDSLFDTLSTLKLGPGVLGVLKKPVWDMSNSLRQPVSPSTFKKGFYLDHVNKPSNIGAIIRNAIAFNFDAVFLSPNCADPFHPESIRAMAGNCLKIPFFTSSLLDIKTSLTDQLTCYGLTPHTKTNLSEIEPREPFLFILGSESKGILPKTNETLLKNTIPFIPIKIPISHVESLNVAATSAIVGYDLRSTSRK